VRKVVLLILFTQLLTLPVYAGVTGKIAGRVVDVETREPLPGVNVLVRGTTMGAATDLEGYYYIINVPVGDYEIEARMIGYEPMTQTDANVSADLTTTIDFDLKPTVIEVPGVTVRAERPMVLRDATATTHVVDAEQIIRQPVHEFTDVIAQQAGVVNSEGGASGATSGLHLRGGRADEVAYMVDGMSVKDPISGQQGTEINVTAFEEMSVITGGFNAEYGQAMSGVVNLVTKEGRKFEGLSRYQTDQFFGGSLDEGRNRFEMSLGGPLPALPKVFYFVSGEVYTRDQQQSYEFPMSHTDREDYSVQGKLTYKVTPTMKVNLSGFLSRDQYGAYGFFIGLPGLDDRSENCWKYCPPRYRRAYWRKAYQLMATLTHQVTSNTFYEAKLGYFKTQNINGHRDMKDEEDRNWWEDLKFNPWWYDIEGDYRDWNAPGWSTKDEDGNYYYPYGVPGVFRLGPPGYWDERKSSYYGTKLDLTSQLTPRHQVKFGVDAKLYNVFRETGQYIYTIESMDSIVNPGTPDEETVKVVVPDKRTIDEALYFDIYDVAPREAALYLQDKIEYPGFVVNLGCRVDYFDANTWRFRDILVTRDSLGNLDTVGIAPKWQVSPRVGISFPVTDRSVFHVAYGHFFQMSRIRWLYDGYNTPRQEQRGAWGLVGNPDLKAQKTIQYEIGLSHQFTDDVALSLTTFYKDLYYLVGVRFIPAVPDPYSAYVTEDYGNVKGLEIVLRKRATEYLSGHLAYSLQQAEGTASWEREAYYDYIANVPVDPYTGEPFVLPVIDYPLEFDQRHTINANVDLLIPDGAGPAIGAVKPLQNLDVSVLTELASGLPYTRRDSRNYLVGETNAERMPWRWTTDLKFTKNFHLFGLKLALFGEITNLFNRKDILNLYPNTGLVADNGMLQDYTTYIDQTFPGDYLDDGQILVGEINEADQRRDLDGDGYITLDEWYDSYKTAYEDFMNDPYMYDDPRHIDIGISLSW